MIWRCRIVFFLTVILYIWAYSPYGINETDAGFLTGLAWQTINGKILYHDLIYVRPPMSVWMRSLELHLLPENWSVLGERWIFYLKIAIYTLLGANVLCRGVRMWQLACFSFVINVHCYPAAAWHTVDGVFLGVVGVWFFQKSLGKPDPQDVLLSILGSLSILAAMLCKQSFYPLLLVPFMYAGLEGFKQKNWISILVLLVSAQFFFFYLLVNHTLANYWSWTNNATSASDAMQTGIFDYFSIHPVKVICFAFMFNFIGYFKHQKMSNKTEKRILLVFLAGFPLGYLFFVLKNQAFTLPFAESRMLFWLALAALFQPFFQVFDIHNLQWSNIKTAYKKMSLPLLSLTLITWCSALSWGYNLPIFFVVPGVFGMMQMLKNMDLHFNPFAKFLKFRKQTEFIAFLYFLLLVFVFNRAYQFIYRDGNRAEMTQHLGEIFPKLNGIYTDQNTADKYCELHELYQKYGGNIQVLPAFPNAKFLMNEKPILNLDWVIKVETGGNNHVLDVLEHKKTFVLFEKSYENEIDENESLDLTKEVLRKRTMIEETIHFKIYANEE
jgi:hypothetical protein